MSKDGPLLRILQHPWLTASMDVDMSVYYQPSNVAVTFYIVDNNELGQNIDITRDAPTYQEAYDLAIQDVLNQMNDLQWPYDPAKEQRLRMDSIRGDNPNYKEY